MLRLFFTLLFALRAIGNPDCDLEYECPSPSSDSICGKNYPYTFNTDCAANVSLAIPTLTFLYLTYTCYNTTNQECIAAETVFYQVGVDSVKETINLTAAEDVYCTFTGCGYDSRNFGGRCWFVIPDFYTCSWPATTIIEEMPSTSLLLSTSNALLATSMNPVSTTLPPQRVPASSSTSDPTNGGAGTLTLPLVVVLVMVFFMTVVVIVTFLGLMCIVTYHSRNKGQPSFTTIPYVPGASGISSMGIIQDDEISLAPSVTTMYATAYFNVYSNSVVVMEDDAHLPGISSDKIPLHTGMEESLPSYKADDDHNSKWKTDSVVTMRSHDNHFGSQTTPQKQTGNGVETMLTSCPQQPTSPGTNRSIPLRSTTSRFLSPDYGYTSNTVLSSSNDGYISSDVSEYKQGRVSISPSASDYQPALLTAMPRLTPSASELSFSTELAEDLDPVDQGRTPNLRHGDVYIHTDLPVMMPASEVDSGYKQVDLFLSPEESAYQPSLTVNVLGKTASLDETELFWEESIEEGNSNPSSQSTDDKHTPLLSREQLLHSCVSFDSSGYLKDDLCVHVPHSCEEDVDEGHLSLGEQSRDGLMSLGSSGYWKDTLTSITLRAPHSDRESLDTVHAPVGASECAKPDTDPQRSVNLVTEYGSLCPADIECSKQDGDGYIYTTMHSRSRQDGSGYVHVLRQSQQDGDGYVHATMQPEHDGDGYVHSTTHSGQDSDRYIHNGHAVMQSGQDGDGYIHATKHDGDGYRHSTILSKENSDGYIHNSRHTVMQSGQDGDGYIHATMQPEHDGDGYIHSTTLSGQDSDGYIHNSHTVMHSGQDGDGYIHATMQPDGYNHSTTLSGQDSNGYIHNCHPVTQSEQDGDGYIHSTMHSGQDSDGYIHAVMQSGQEGDGYVDSGLAVFPSVARSTNELNSSYSNNLGKDELLLTTKVGVYSITSQSDVESTISDNDDYVQCDVLNIQPVQSSTLRPTCYSNRLEVNDCSGYVQSADSFTSAPNGMPRPLSPTTDGYIYT